MPSKFRWCSDREKHDFKSYFTFTSGDNWVGDEVEGMVRYAHTTFSPCPWWPKGSVWPQKRHKALRALGTLKEEPRCNFGGQGPVWTTCGMCCLPWCVVTTVLLREPKCLIVGWTEIRGSTWNPQQQIHLWGPEYNLSHARRSRTMCSLPSDLAPCFTFISLLVPTA